MIICYLCARIYETKIIKQLKMKYLHTLIITLLMPISMMAQGWDENVYQSIENSIHQPSFANREYSIIKYGAQLTATPAQNQKAINKAIAACSKAGGGRVVVPEGVWNTGPITLLSNVNLVVEKGATLLFAFDLNCPCINHGFDLNSQLAHQKMAVDSGYWTLLRYNPALAAEGKAPLILDSKKPTIPVAEYIYTENRYKQLTRNNPEVAKKLADDLQKEVDARYAFYDAMSKDTEGLISL